MKTNNKTRKGYVVGCAFHNNLENAKKSKKIMEGKDPSKIYDIYFVIEEERINYCNQLAFFEISREEIIDS